MAQILIIADTFSPNRGGSEAYLKTLAEGLAQNRHTVKVFTPAVSGSVVQAAIAGVQIQRSTVWFKLQNWGAHSNPLVNRFSRLSIFPFLFMRLILSHGDIVIAGHIIPAGVVGSALIRLRRFRALLVITYGEEITVYKRGMRMRKLMRSVLAAAHNVTVLTESSRAELEEVRSGTALKTVVVPPAVSSYGKDLTIENLPLFGNPVLLTLSRLVERKGIDTAILAVHLLTEEFPNLRYYIAGVGPFKTHLMKLVRGLGLDNHVIFLGSVQDVDSLYAQCDFFCMPNRQMSDGEREGFGMVFLEAGLHGKPSIAGNSGGAVEAVLHGKTGLIVFPDDPAATAEAIRDLASNSQYRDELGQAAKMHAEDFTPRRMVNSFEFIIQRLLTK